MDEASKLLMKAADLIERRGHCKGTAEYKGRFCVQGAINYCATGNPFFTQNEFALQAKDRVADFVKQREWVWNNAPERTAEEVIATLRRVAIETDTDTATKQDEISPEAVDGDFVRILERLERLGREPVVDVVHIEDKP